MEEEKVKLIKDDDDEEAGGGGMLPGFRFHPTDEELVGFYLPVKVEKKKISTRTSIRLDQLIRQIDIYKYDPWDLPSTYFIYTQQLVYISSYLQLILNFLFDQLCKCFLIRTHEKSGFDYSMLYMYYIYS